MHRVLQVSIWLPAMVFVFSFSSVLSQSQSEVDKIRIASSQFPVSANIDSNAIWVEKHIREAKAQSCDLVHFPECALSGYAGVDHESLEHLDWTTLKSRTKEIIQLADSLDIWVILGSTHPLSPGNKPHNSLYVIGPDGTIRDRYDKRFCTAGDLNHYTAGNHFVDFNVNGIKCGLLICYDVRFPELYRAYQKEGVRVIFQSFYNARQKPGSIHPVIMPLTAQARAATNSFYMSLTNSSAQHSWPCHFITPDGLIGGKLAVDEPGLLISDIDISAKFYDASAPFRSGAIDGKLSSGETVTDPRSLDRTAY